MMRAVDHSYTNICGRVFLVEDAPIVKYRMASSVSKTLLNKMAYHIALSHMTNNKGEIPGTLLSLFSTKCRFLYGL